MQGITDAGVDEPVWLELSPDQAATIAADVLRMVVLPAFVTRDDVQERISALTAENAITIEFKLTDVSLPDPPPQRANLIREGDEWVPAD